MTDIVQRLRKRHEMQYQGELRAIPSIFTEAADEIERLRAVWQSDDALFDRVDDGLKQAEDEIERLREELEDAKAIGNRLIAENVAQMAEIERLRTELAKSQNLASIALDRVTEPKARRP